MTIDGRDRAIVQFVARFNQVASAHVHEVFFFDRASRTPCDRALKRLVETNYLHRIERRTVGGAHAGSGQYVYALGRRGFYLGQVGRYSPARSVNYHSLAIVDCFVELRRLERAGLLRLVGMTTEPDCWVQIGRTELKPDLYIDVSANAQRSQYWLEVDMGTEGQSQLKRKLEAFWRAYQDADVNVWPVFPATLWVAVDKEREKELAWLMEQGPVDARPLFRVCRRETIGVALGVLNITR